MFAWMQAHGIRDWRVLSVFPNGRARQQDEFLLEPSELRRLLDFVRAKRSRPQPLRVSYGDEGSAGVPFDGGLSHRTTWFF